MTGSDGIGTDDIRSLQIQVVFILNYLPVRKLNRLREFDYSTPGDYFVTICVKDKTIKLSEITPDRTGKNTVLLTETGKTVEKKLIEISKVYQYAKLDEYMIMPDHVHAIITILENSERKTTLSKIVGYFKAAVTKESGISIWQKSFYDSILDSEEMYYNAVDYIQQNPYRWQEKYFPENIKLIP